MGKLSTQGLIYFLLFTIVFGIPINCHIVYISLQNAMIHLYQWDRAELHNLNRYL